MHGLGVGEWVYFRFNLPTSKSILVEVIDVSDANSDAMLVLNVNDLPTMSHYEYTDFYDWY